MSRNVAIFLTVVLATHTAVGAEAQFELQLDATSAGNTGVCAEESNPALLDNMLALCAQRGLPGGRIVALHCAGPNINAEIRCGGPVCLGGICSADVGPLAPDALAAGTANLGNQEKRALAAQGSGCLGGICPAGVAPVAPPLAPDAIAAGTANLGNQEKRALAAQGSGCLGGICPAEVAPVAPLLASDALAAGTANLGNQEKRALAGIRGPVSSRSRR